MRDFGKIIDRLKRLDLPLKIIGTVNDFPIHLLQLESFTDANKKVLITGGVHGDEPAGVEAVLQFLARDNTELLKRFSFVVIPCVNPYGYVHDTRENSDGIDINRSFEEEKVSEVVILKHAFGQTQFTLTIDFHEDYEATGFYLYEGKRDKKYLGPKIANAVQSIGPIDTEDSGEDTSEITTGVYKVASKWGTQGLAPYLLHYHSEHVIITETPTVWQLEQRAALHLGVLDTVLSYF